jgi:pimeloyl-ACP methyl ester carboxylesterase
MRMQKVRQNIKFLGLLCLSITLLLGFSSSTYSGFASPENKTLMQPQGVQGMATNATNIVLVHGVWADGSSWSKVIPILKNAGHKIIAVQLPLTSLADDVATVKRAIDLVGGPTILVGHSYGGFVITNAGYNNQNVTGLVYVSAFGPDQGESTANFVDVAKLPPGLLVFDSGGFAYINPEMFHQAFVQDAKCD